MGKARRPKVKRMWGLKVQRQGIGFTKTELMDLQSKIEDLTMKFDDDRNQLLKCSSNLIKLLIREDEPSAKEYLKRSLAPEDITMVHHFGFYTQEAIIIHVLGLLFNCVRDYPFVRVSTLVEQQDSAVRVQAAVIMASGKIAVHFESGSEGSIKPGKRKVTRRSHYYIGANLVNFLVERGLIHLSSEVSFTELSVVNKKGQGYLPSCTPPRKNIWR